MNFSELTEETGLDATTVLEPGVLVQRYCVWNGSSCVGREVFFLARFSAERPPASGAGMLPAEHRNFRGYGWFSLDELAELGGLLEPPALHAVIVQLVLCTTPDRFVRRVRGCRC